MFEVRVNARADVERRRVASRRRPRCIGDDGLDPLLVSLGEFLSAPGKDLDAVVFKRIVGRGDDNPKVVVARTRQVRNGRRRHDADGRDGRAADLAEVRTRQVRVGGGAGLEVAGDAPLVGVDPLDEVGNAFSK